MAIKQIGDIDPTKPVQLIFSDGTVYNRSPDEEWTDESNNPLSNFTSLFLESIYVNKDVTTSEVISLKAK